MLHFSLTGTHSHFQTNTGATTAKSRLSSPPPDCYSFHLDSLWGFFPPPSQVPQPHLHRVVPEDRPTQTLGEVGVVLCTFTFHEVVPSFLVLPHAATVSRPAGQAPALWPFGALTREGAGRPLRLAQLSPERALGLLQRGWGSERPGAAAVVHAVRRVCSSAQFPVRFFDPFSVLLLPFLSFVGSRLLCPVRLLSRDASHPWLSFTLGGIF